MRSLTRWSGQKWFGRFPVPARKLDLRTGHQRVKVSKFGCNIWIKHEFSPHDPGLEGTLKNPIPGVFQATKRKMRFSLCLHRQLLKTIENGGASPPRTGTLGCSREGLKNSDLPLAQGCAGKINCDKRLILKQAANRVCVAACPDKARDGFFRAP